ncbi:MAG: A/G-specific adenine glycosylase [Chloroflexi bacterium]|nr:A/G-specific adenine glycosylase [Chloroflexota bacterium]
MERKVRRAIPLARAPLVHDKLLSWFERAGRHLPWRQHPTPYGTLVSEFMLQQTQVERVVPRYERFLETFPTLYDLAAATPADVLRTWSGLGYNRRAIRLLTVARVVVERFGGALPPDVTTLRNLEGIGAYTAHAIACFAFGAQVATVDTNVKRVLARITGMEPAPDIITDRQAWSLATAWLPQGQATAWNQALMDLGAIVCTARTPQCQHCPLLEPCRAGQRWQTSGEQPPLTLGRKTKEEPFRGSRRFLRGRIIRALVEAAPNEEWLLSDLHTTIRERHPDFSVGDVSEAIRQLATDGLLSIEERGGAPVISLHKEDDASRESSAR